MFGIGIPEIAIISVLIILIFGGRKFAELGKGLGEGIFGFRKGIAGKTEEKEDKGV